MSHRDRFLFPLGRHMKEALDGELAQIESIKAQSKETQEAIAQKKKELADVKATCEKTEQKYKQMTSQLEDLQRKYQGVSTGLVSSVDDGSEKTLTDRLMGKLLFSPLVSCCSPASALSFVPFSFFSPSSSSPSFCLFFLLTALSQMPNVR